MTDTFSMDVDIGLIGCGRLGSALVEGWLATPGFKANRLTIIARHETLATDQARAAGAMINPSPDRMTGVGILVLAVKPAVWREALQPFADVIPEDTVVASVMAGVRLDDIRQAAGGRPVARLMPTTAVAQRQGVAGLYASDSKARTMATALFEGMADVVPLEDENLLDAATGVAGSAPAFIYAFVQALARAGEVEGLTPDAAVRLARGALRSAAAGVSDGQSLEDAIERIASKGGTTRAGLDALEADGGAERAVAAAVSAAVARARELSR
ncbi:pyrroline-5-carboxylate reductase dimerization domain-containing protein [Brevundimonas sp.]|uniref:pyrroline-5-carboxylate reductase family protein n=1 Tax=Brevundimonas sp. TaxID=1871086 RepID=UPI001D8CDCAF|nr:pyrroline-5-carboxylate reductase dimerization domain-containing protein [Brevundimonas sp.]MBL0946918.1 NAD(P)-binding domain-containing protein [Brevundimonas sp.]